MAPPNNSGSGEKGGQPVRGGGGSTAERSSAEIKDLLRKLHPAQGNHKDRIRRLNKFRNYVQPPPLPNGKPAPTPEFYDDDIPLLYLGAETPAIYLDDDEAADDVLPIRRLYYGLLFAAGTLSDSHNNSGGGGTPTLKRSARHAMNLLKWLLTEWRDTNSTAATGDGNSSSSGDPPLNLFARAFMSLPVQYYRHLQLNLHATGDDRGGAKEDACHIIALILCYHSDAAGEMRSVPVLLEELVTTPVAQQAYDLWSARNATTVLTPRQQELIKKNTLLRQAEIAAQQRQEAVLNKNKASLTAGGGGGGDLDLILEDSENQDASEHYDNNQDHDDNRDNDNNNNDDRFDDDDESEIDELDVMAAMRKRQKTIRKELAAMGGGGGGGGRRSSTAAAVRWEDSQLAREQAVRDRAFAAAAASAAASAAAAQSDTAATAAVVTVRDSADLAHEMQAREDEKSKLLSKDPLGILNVVHQQEEEDDDGGEQFDLRHYENAQAEQMELALHEVQDEILKAESGNNEEVLKKFILQKESLEQLIEKLGGLEAMENHNNTNRASILPTRSNFHPLLFLTLLHRKTPYKDLVASMERLSSKTENQAEQLQNLVRDNFPLFVRCAEGFEEFRTNSETEVGLGVNERIEKLEAIAESAAFQAKKSFKPLLDNTSEVRKVQSALAVLQRVAPILQVPALMRQHIENRRYSQALKTYRRSLVVDDSCNISLLTHVKLQAEQCVRDARRDLERCLTQGKGSVEDLLVGIRDLGELLELEVPAALDSKKKAKRGGGGGGEGEEEVEGEEEKPEENGIYAVDGTIVNIREHPPALACLLLQAAHFASACKNLIAKAEDTSQRIFAGESLQSVQTNVTASPAPNDSNKESEEAAATTTTTPKAGNNNNSASSGNQWKYDVLDARVLSTIKAVDIAREWLPRLVRVGKAAREEEKRRAARIGHRNRSTMKENHYLTSFEVFVVNIAPSLTRLVEHAAFCSLGSNTRTGAKYVEMSFGQTADEKLRTLLRSPLPPSQSTKVGKELAALVELLDECSSGVDDLRPDSALLQLSPLGECMSLGDSAVVTIEKRRCIYAFDVCSRACSNRASGSGKFDADALLNCLQNLAEQLSRPEECSNEVEKGCELVVRRCCEGLASYVRDRGDDARLSAVAECADVMAERVDEVVREAAALTSNSEAVREVIMEDIMGLEGAMFDEYLESIRQHVANSVRVGWLDKDAAAAEGAAGDVDSNLPPSFPSYLSASLLAIVRCRAQVEQALGDRIRRAADGVPYQHLSMATVADGVVEGICNEVMKRKLKLKVRQADRLANELEFLNNTLKKFLGEDALALLDSTLHMVSSKAGRARNYQGDGPDGLAALEELERLGRVYVLCLGD